MEHKSNKELQEQLAKFPDETPIGIGIKHNGLLTVYHDVNVQCAKKEDLQVVIINSKDIDEEYEVFYDGGTINDKQNNCEW